VSNFAACAQFVRASVAAFLSASVLAGFATQAVGAEEAEDQEEEDVVLTEVQVTGTRIQSPNVTSANPITSVTGDEMRQLGFVNVADALTMLVPQNISTYQPNMIGDNQAGSGGGGMESLDRGSYFIGQTIANLRGMDPTFGTRTLTLIDGRRSVSTSNQADVVDMNIIPSNLLQRMDVVTGGASATYGSGAMAGVVNLVLNNRMQGVNVDFDYGFNEAGDGGSPHVSVSGGTSLFGGRGHALVGLEWQKSEAIRNCAEARSWCAESRAMFTNSSGSTQNPLGVLASLPGFEGLPARFEMSNLRYNQFAPSGTIYHGNTQFTSGFRFNAEGTDVEEYSYGYRGGNGSGAGSMNGDGPLLTDGTPMRASSDRKTLFTNFEYNFTERTTGYFQGNYAKTTGLNRNRYTQGSYCVRFNSPGTAAVVGGAAGAGELVSYGGGAATSFDYNTGAPVIYPTRNVLWNVANFRAFLGYRVNGAPATLTAPSTGAPYWVISTAFAQYGATSSSPPSAISFENGTPVWAHVRNNNPTTGTEYWILMGVEITAPFDDPGSPAVMPQMGRNAYAFLNNLSPEALHQVQRAFGVPSGANNVYGAIQGADGALMTGATITASGGASTGLDTLYGPNACNGFTAMRKVWNPQLQQWTDQESETMRALAGVKGRFGSDWRWDAYYQYGQTESASTQNNVATNLRLAMAMDAVIDDRVGSATFGEPICRITRDGPPVLDYEGLPLSNVDELAAIAAGCTPINIFGYNYSDPAAAARQAAAIDFAFVDSVSQGANDLHTLSLSTNGTLWQGWAGPLTAAFGLEVRQDSVDNAGTDGVTTYYERADLASVWSDAYSGKTRVTEGYSEFNMPLVTAVEGVNLLSLNLGARYASYYNKGGKGTTGQDATQNVFNWKASAVYEPFDFVRFRLTRSRDLRAATYRDLFTNQPGLPDQFSGVNPWRERTAFSDENQTERFGQLRVGNPNLKPETSDTLTLGTVLSPGGWAQGMRVSIDYYKIDVKNGIAVPFNSARPITACWEGSGNIAQGYFDDGSPDPDRLGVNGLIDMNLQACQEITFATNPDGSRNLQDIVSYNSSRPTNALPIQRRGVDVAVSYSFPLNRAFESVPGSLSLSVRGTRALESSGIQLNSSLANSTTNCEAQGGYFQDFNCYIPRDLVGQIRNSVFIPGVAATPKWTGNISATYLMGDLTTSLSARYIGAAAMDKTWTDDPNDPRYMNDQGQLLNGSVDNNWVKPYMNFALNGSYNLDVGDLKQFQVFGSISNLFDKSPPFTGGGLSGASAQYHDTYGRAYRMGVRMRF